jgi:hypothetical protein
MENKLKCFKAGPFYALFFYAENKFACTLCRALQIYRGTDSYVEYLQPLLRKRLYKFCNCFYPFFFDSSRRC